MDNDELKDLKELKAIKEEYGWSDDNRDYKIRLKAIQKKYSQLAKAESKPKGGNVKTPGQPMKKMVWGSKGGFKEVTTDAEEWDDAFDLLQKIKKGEWDVDRSAPGNVESNVPCVHVTAHHATCHTTVCPHSGGIRVVHEDTAHVCPALRRRPWC